jgi:exonuclease III
MRLVTWNCCRGPHAKKVELLGALQADIAVIQECARPHAESESLLWFGDNPRQGIAVVARGGYRLKRLRRARKVPRYVFPVEVSGPHSFTLLAVWTKDKQEYRYIRAAVRAVHLYRKLIESGPTVLAGDTNSNVIWDKHHPVEMNHSALVKKLAGYGMVSAYHTFFNEAQGKETRPTYYFLWQKAKPFHIDYCFIPQQWMPAVRQVSVEPFETWREHSDHRPLVVDIAL